MIYSTVINNRYYDQLLLINRLHIHTEESRAEGNTPPPPKRVRAEARDLERRKFALGEDGLHIARIVQGAIYIKLARQTRAVMTGIHIVEA